MNFGQIDKDSTHFKSNVYVCTHFHFVKFQSVIQLFNYVSNFK